MGLERAYLLNPERKDIAKSLTVAYSNLHMPEEALRVYGRVTDPKSWFSSKEYPLIKDAVNHAAESKNPQVAAAINAALGAASAQAQGGE